jgi:hypothetical protein
MSVLGQKASHLLLIRNNLGYGIVLTAACARQGCSYTDYYYSLLLLYIEGPGVNRVNWRTSLLHQRHCA